MRTRLQGISLGDIALSQFIEHLVRTKKPQIYAETAVVGDGSDWSQMELSILGDISVAVPVTIYDNGLHRSPPVYGQTFGGMLLFTPGALLRNGRGRTPADWDEVVGNGCIDQRLFSALYLRRLLPPLLFASRTAINSGRKAFVTIPGLGCGQFAGPFLGQVGPYLDTALSELLQIHHADLPGIQAVYFDPYSECENQRTKIGHIDYMVRPLTRGNGQKPQLCMPIHYADSGDEFSDCDLYSVVAWDHVSWPGNDFYGGSRATDDGVKAAATNSMAILTGVEGKYDAAVCKYLPPNEHRNWEEVIEVKKVDLEVEHNIQILPEI
ncbi:MAG: hypothetical protein KDI14_16615 [Halioglobus sp.]|nr:hypothetical protein [Halioglobus sp.]